MHYYIDGYNLLFRLLKSEKNFSSNRQQLIEDLNEKFQSLQIEATIVFDSQYQPEEGTRTHFGDLEILFTDHGETADDRILDEIQAERGLSRITVVTSDKKLAWFARRCRAETESTEHFLEWVNKRIKNKLRKPAIPKIQKKEPQKPPVKTAEIKKITYPSADKTAGECFEYYLSAFESEFQKIEKEKPKTKHSKTPRKKKKFLEDQTAHEEKGLTDMERWLKIFEKNSKL